MIEVRDVGLVGGGFVGATHAKVLQDRGAKVKVYDVNKKYFLNWPESWALPAVKPLKEVANCDVVIVSVPTPPVGYTPDGICLECDTKYADETIEKISNLTKKKKQPVILKSTVPVGYTKKLNKIFENLQIFFSPEFLTEATPLEDLKNPDRIVFGTESLLSEWTEEDAKAFYVVDTIQENGCQTVICSTTEAEMIKLGSNSFLATKVIYANMLYKLCEAHGANYDKVKVGIGADKRIGEHHMIVPGPDGHFGYSKSCFPKDVANLGGCFLDKFLYDAAAFLNLIEDMNISYRKNTDWVNNEYRKKNN